MKAPRDEANLAVMLQRVMVVCVCVCVRGWVICFCICGMVFTCEYSHISCICMRSHILSNPVQKVDMEHGETLLLLIMTTQVICASSLLGPIFTFTVRRHPLVALVIMTRAKEEVNDKCTALV